MNVKLLLNNRYKPLRRLCYRAGNFAALDGGRFNIAGVLKYVCSRNLE